MKIKKLKFFTLLFLFTANINCQNKIKTDTLSKLSFNELATKFYAAKKDSLKAVLIAEFYIRKAKQENDTIELGEGYYFLSDITKDAKYYLNYWNEISDITKNLKNKIYPSLSFLMIGDYYYQFGDKSKALKNYFNANNYFNSVTDSVKYIVYNRFGMLKSSSGDYNSAIKYYNKSFNYYNNINDAIYSSDYYSLVFNLAVAYSSIQKYDSAYYFNSQLLNKSKQTGNIVYLGYSLNNKGIIEYKRRNYKQAIIDLKESVPYLLKDINFRVLSSTYHKIAFSNIKTNNQKKALNYYLKIDSIFTIDNNYLQHHRNTYKFLISYYKEENNLNNELKFINKYIKVDSQLSKRERKISRDLTNKLDIPNLMAEKKLIENKLSRNKKWLVFIISLSILLLVFLIYQIKKRNLYKERFHKLYEKKSSLVQPIITKKENTNNIPLKTLNHILKSLDKFESNKDFLSPKTSLTSLASKFKTNSKYVSQIINQNKNQSFNNYINSLRVNYAIEMLKNNSQFRKYNIKGIATEIGFNNSESFSKAFYKNTGIKPSYFIKKLDKNNF